MHTNELAILLSGLSIKDLNDFKSLEEAYDRYKDKIKKRNISKELDYIEKNNIEVINFFDDKYPNSLRQIPYPPVTLYVKGKLKEMELPIAIVGTRYPSGYGEKVVKYLTENLVDAGFSIISGLALGIDAMAHAWTLNKGGYTVAVLGCGIDVVYPQKNKNLFKRIEENGCIISEFPISTPPNRYNFPARNRIIAGLSKGTIVVEADIKSGSLITARLTAEQGKPVFAVPGEIFSKRSRGTNKLISEGAIPVLDINSILSYFYLELKADLDRLKEENTELTEKEKLVLNSLEGEMNEDELSSSTGLNIEELSEILFDLELKGLIKRTAIGYQKI